MARKKFVGRRRKGVDDDDDVQFIGCSKRKLDDFQDVSDVCLDVDFSQGAHHDSASKWRRTDAGKAAPDHHHYHHDNDYGASNNNCAGSPHRTPTLFTPAALKATREYQQAIQTIVAFGWGSAAVEAGAEEPQARETDRTNERLRKFEEDLRESEERLRADQERLDEARERKDDIAEDARGAVEHAVVAAGLLVKLEQRSAESARARAEAAAPVQGCKLELGRRREQAASLGAAKSAYIDTLPAVYRDLNEEQGVSNAVRELDSAYEDAVAAVLSRHTEIERGGLAYADYADWLDSSLGRSRDRLHERAEELEGRGELSPEDVQLVKQTVSDAEDQCCLGRKDWPGCAWGTQVRDEHVPMDVKELRREEQNMLRAALELETRRLRHKRIAGRVASFSAMQHAAGEEVERCETLLANLTAKEEMARAGNVKASFRECAARQGLEAAVLEMKDLQENAAGAAAEEEGVQTSVRLSKEARDKARAAVASARQLLLRPQR